MSFLQSESFIPNPEFETRRAKAFLTPPAELEIYKRARVGRRIDGNEAGVHKLLTPAGEKFLFLRMNYLKYAAAKSSRQEQRRDLLSRAIEVRNEIAECNYGLVVSISNRFVPQLDFDEVVSECCLVLLKSIEKFDVGRGFKFSTYATHSLQRHAYRMSQQKLSQRVRGVQTEFLTETVAEPDREETFITTQPAQIDSVIREMEGYVDVRERFVLRQRFGLDGPAGTLREVAEVLGVTKERVRQIQVKAIEKIRVAMRERRIELPGVVSRFTVIEA